MAIAVKSLERQTDMCPTQWFGWAVDGRAIYARYRSGALTVTVGVPHGVVPDYVGEGEQLVWLHPTDRLAGAMGTQEMIQRTRAFLDFEGALLTDTCSARADELLRIIKRLPDAHEGRLIREGHFFLVPVQPIDETEQGVFLTHDRKALE